MWKQHGINWDARLVVSNHDISKTIQVVAKDAKTGKQIKLAYTNKKITGNGSFGVVYQTKLVDTNEDAAIKKVLQDKRFKVYGYCVYTRYMYALYWPIWLQNRELQLMRIVDHPNVCRLKSYFYNQVENKVERNQNIAWGVTK